MHTRLWYLQCVLCVCVADFRNLMSWNRSILSRFSILKFGSVCRVRNSVQQVHHYHYELFNWFKWAH